MTLVILTLVPSYMSYASKRIFGLKISEWCWIRKWDIPTLLTTPMAGSSNSFLQAFLFLISDVNVAYNQQESKLTELEAEIDKLTLKIEEYINGIETKDRNYRSCEV